MTDVIAETDACKRASIDRTVWSQRDARSAAADVLG